MIDLKRLERLISGEELPVDANDEVFLRCYNSGASGELLFTLLINFKETLDKFTHDEMNFVLLGYSMGQIDCAENGMDLIISLDKKNEPKKNTH